MKRSLPVALLLLLSGRPGFAQSPHPLEPLSPAEMEEAARLVRSDSRFTGTSRFATLGFREPPKREVLAWTPGAPVPRAALAAVMDVATATMSEVVVDLGQHRIERWTPMPNAQPWFMKDDLRIADSLLSRDPRWVAALANHQLTPDQIMVFPVPADGYFPFTPDGGRYLTGLALLKSPRSGDVTGLSSLINLRTRQVLRVTDRGGPVHSYPEVELDSIRKLPPAGEAPKPIRITFPEGTSYSVDGHHVSWLDWQFRFGVESRSGLVLYRAAPSEMAVPYGDPGWRIWQPRDIGWVGLGNYSKTSLTPGIDVPDSARFFESVMHDDDGKPIVVPRAAALYERDGGILWRHGDLSRRARNLVLAFYAKVDNYDYGFFWVFHQDGTLELELQLTGQMGTKAVPVGAKADQYGTLVAPGVIAPNHQHFFSFRLDLDVDGPDNRVVEMNVLGERAAPYRPAGLAARETVLRSELGAIRQLDLSTRRMWKVESATRTNSLGTPTAYALMPGENSTPMVPPGSHLRRMVGFVNAHLWVTPERDDEIYAAGTYAYIGRAGDGLPRWTRANRPLVDRDVVLWYTLGVTHIPRPEDWPLMPVHRTGFKLVPVGFSSENPTIAVPVR
jgi:primary-amine oxidase